MGGRGELVNILASSKNKQRAESPSLSVCPKEEQRGKKMQRLSQ